MKALRFHRMLLIAALALGCEGGPESRTPYAPCVTSETLELGTLLVEVESELDGTVRGVDLDGRDSDATDDFGCNHEDWDDPDGTPVDNQFATLTATIEAGFEVNPREVFPDNALTLRIEGRGDGVCAAVGVALDDGPWRTAEWNGTTLRAYDLGDLPLRFALPEVSATVTLHDAAVRIKLADHRVASVVLSGALEVDELVPVVADSTLTVGEPLIRTTLHGVADLDPVDGQCQRISVGLEALP